MSKAAAKLTGSMSPHVVGASEGFTAILETLKDAELRDAIRLPLVKLGEGIRGLAETSHNDVEELKAAVKALQEYNTERDAAEQLRLSEDARLAAEREERDRRMDATLRRLTRESDKRRSGQQRCELKS